MRADSAARRVADVVFSGLLLAVLLPLFAIIAFAIRVDSPGPVFYRAVRVGRGGREFRMLKFRSMVADADRLGPAVSGTADDRVTPVGHLLRTTKLDELPQLLNVLAGTMTLIGPRAESPVFERYYTQAELVLFDVRPGMTGPGQLEFTVSQATELDGVDDPDRYYVEHQLHDKLALDLEYVRHRGLGRDLAAVAATLRVMFGLRPRAGRAAEASLPTGGVKAARPGEGVR